MPPRALHTASLLSVKHRLFAFRARVLLRRRLLCYINLHPHPCPPPRLPHTHTHTHTHTHMETAGEKLMEAINGDGNMKMKVGWGTPSEYLDAAYPDVFQPSPSSEHPMSPPAPPSPPSTVFPPQPPSPPPPWHTQRGQIEAVGELMSEDASGDALPYHGTVCVRVCAWRHVCCRGKDAGKPLVASARASQGLGSTQYTYYKHWRVCVPPAPCHLHSFASIHSSSNSSSCFARLQNVHTHARMHAHTRAHTHAHTDISTHSKTRWRVHTRTRKCTDTLDIAGVVTGGLLYDNYWSGYYGTRCVASRRF